MAKRPSFSQTKKSPAAKVQLTSLMDALTIILIFLLTNYSDNPQEVEIPEFVKLPKIYGKNTAAEAKQSIIVSISQNEIQIGKNKEDIHIKFNDYKSELDRVVLEFKEHLDKYKKDLESSRERDLASADGTNKDKPKFNLSFQADKDVPYDFIDALMFASNQVGLNYFDFTLEKVDE